jgi:hypothetical protein
MHQQTEERQGPDIDPHPASTTPNMKHSAQHSGGQDGSNAHVETGAAHPDSIRPRDQRGHRRRRGSAEQTGQPHHHGASVEDQIRHQGHGIEHTDQCDAAENQAVEELNEQALARKTCDEEAVSRHQG